MNLYKWICQVYVPGIVRQFFIGWCTTGHAWPWMHVHAHASFWHYPYIAKVSWLWPAASPSTEFLAKPMLNVAQQTIPFPFFPLLWCLPPSTCTRGETTKCYSERYKRNSAPKCRQYIYLQFMVAPKSQIKREGVLSVELRGYQSHRITSLLLLECQKWLPPDILAVERYIRVILDPSTAARVTGRVSAWVVVWGESVSPRGSNINVNTGCHAERQHLGFHHMSLVFVCLQYPIDFLCCTLLFLHRGVLFFLDFVSAWRLTRSMTHRRCRRQCILPLGRVPCRSTQGWAWEGHLHIIERTDNRVRPKGNVILWAWTAALLMNAISANGRTDKFKWHRITSSSSSSSPSAGPV